MSLGMEIQRNIATGVAFGQTSHNSSRSVTAPSGEWHHQHSMNVWQSLGRLFKSKVQGGSNMTGTDLYVNKPHCAAAVRP